VPEQETTPVRQFESIGGSSILQLLTKQFQCCSFSSSTDDDDEDGAISLGTEDSDDDDEEEDEDEVQVVAGTDQVGVAGGPPAAISLGRRSAFGDSLGSPSVARMPGSNGGYEMVASRPVQNYNWTPPHIKATYIDTHQIHHVIVIFLLPSGIGVKDASGFRLAIKVFGVDHYLSLEIEWPETFDLDNGEIFLELVKKQQLKQMQKKWMDLPTIEQTMKAKREFDRTHVMRCMAVGREMVRCRLSKGRTKLGSETSVKLDFATERLTDTNWWLIGDDTTGHGGVRMVVVDLEEAAAEEHQGQVVDRAVVMIGDPQE